MMVLCRCCGKEIHQTALACPHCGGMQSDISITPMQTTDGSLWGPIASLVLGIISILAVSDDESDWDRNAILRVFLFCAVGFVLGAVSINKQKTGKGMAITGVVLSTIALIVLIGDLL